MSKIVVFAEKNTAAKKIADILGNKKVNTSRINNLPVYTFKRNSNDWSIVGLAGHIMSYDFDPSLNDWKKIDPKSLLTAMPVKQITKQKYANTVNTLSQKADEIILACDYDREGENIGFEAKYLAEKINPNTPFKRAKYSSFTKKEIENAFDNLVQPDENMANAAETRQILDLKMGAAFTRRITLKVQENVFHKGVISIGPCQSPTCGFVYKREKQIRDFQPEYFWKLLAILDKNNTQFETEHKQKKFDEQSKAKSIYNKIKNEKNAIVNKLNVRQAKVDPPYPLNTNEFLKRASKFLNISPENALEVAEKLYLQGIISYPRTETNKYDKDFDFKAILQDLDNINIYQQYASSILGNNPIKCNNGKKDAQDHPPIHPVRALNKAGIEREVNDTNAFPIYDLIVRHFIANLMEKAIFENTDVEFLIKDEPFTTKGKIKKYDGWMAVYPFEKKKEQTLPQLSKGESVTINKVSTKKSQTKPPKKITEAELLSLMDKNNIGTKSTAPAHIETNKTRGYFQAKGKTISILEKGYNLMDSLAKSSPIIINPEIRAEIEQLIQDVEDGKVSFDDAIEKGTHILTDTYNKVNQNIDELASNIQSAIREENAKKNGRMIIGKCPDCNNSLQLIKTQNNKRFIGCTNYPDCKRSYPVPKSGKIKILKKVTCKKGSPYVLMIDDKYGWALGIGPCFKCENNKTCIPQPKKKNNKTKPKKQEIKK